MEVRRLILAAVTAFALMAAACAQRTDSPRAAPTSTPGGRETTAGDVATELMSAEDALARMVLPPEAFPYDGMRVAIRSGERTAGLVASETFATADGAASVLDEGYVDGYGLILEATQRASGVVSAASSVDQFDNADDALAFVTSGGGSGGDLSVQPFDLGRGVMRVSTEMLPALAHPLPSGAHLTLTSMTGASGEPLALARVKFARGSWVGTVTIVASGNTFPQDDTESLAAALDQRISDTSSGQIDDDAPSVPGEAFDTRVKAGGTIIGLRCSYASRYLVERFGLPPGEGCVIVRVSQGGAAERAGTKLGDKIIEMDGVPITSGRQFAYEFTEKAGGDERILVVERGRETVALRVKLSRTASAPEDDPFRFYLRAKDIYLQQTQSPDYEGAIENMTRQIEADPDFDLAYLYRGTDRWSLADERGAPLDDAAIDIERALALDPDLPEAHEARAMMLFYDFNQPAAAFEHIDRAIALAGCPAVVAPWDYDCGLYILRRAEFHIGGGQGVDALVDADLAAIRYVTGVEVQREAAMNGLTNDRMWDALRNGTCERDGVPVECVWVE